MSDQWLSIVEYARTYNVSDMTIRRRIKTGKLQAVLRDGKYYIPLRKEVVAAPEAVTVRPSPVVEAPVSAVTAKPVKTFHTPLERSQVTSSSPAVENQMVSILGTCEKALQKISQNEQRMEEQYQAKIAQLESQLQLKDMHIANLEQQVEDLNLLIKILDKA